MRTRTGASFISVRQCDFILFTRSDTSCRRRDCDAIMDYMSKITYALPILDSQESDFMPERTVVQFT